METRPFPLPIREQSLCVTTPVLHQHTYSVTPMGKLAQELIWMLLFPVLLQTSLRLKDPPHRTLSWWRNLALPCRKQLHRLHSPSSKPRRPSSVCTSKHLKHEETLLWCFSVFKTKSKIKQALLCYVMKTHAALIFKGFSFFDFISNLVIWNFHVLWSRISFKGIGYRSLSSPMQNSCSHTLKNLCYLQRPWIRVF